MYVADFSTYEVAFVLRNQLDSFIQEARTDFHLMNCNDLGHLIFEGLASSTIEDVVMEGSGQEDR
jgi:hypothetical protein